MNTMIILNKITVFVFDDLDPDVLYVYPSAHYKKTTTRLKRFFSVANRSPPAYHHIIISQRKTTLFNVQLYININ